MKTKPEILSECTGIELPELEFKNEVQVVRPSEALEAMSEYAKQEAQEFAEWCVLSLYEYNETNNVWCKYPDTYTTSELYTKFDEERNKQ